MLALGAVLATLLLEGWLAWTTPQTPFHLRRPNSQRVLSTDPELMPGIEGAASYTINSQGVRGPEWGERANETRILCVGGSTTECLYLADDETWPALLAADLQARRVDAARRTWVGGAGVTGYSSIHHLEFLRTSPLIDSVDAVVVLMGVNDLWQDLLQRTDQERLDLASPAGLQRSRVVRLAHRLYDRARARTVGGLEHWAYPMARLRRERAAATKTDTPPDLCDAWSRYAERIDAMVGVARSRGVRLCFVTQPVSWAAGQDEAREESYWFGWLPGGQYLSTTALRATMDRYNELLKQRCAALGVECVDTSSMNGGREWFIDDCHFSEAGARELARLVADALSTPARDG